MRKLETFQTQNLYQAAFLLSQNFKLINVITGQSKTSLVFEGFDVRSAALNFYNGSSVDAKSYSDAYRTLKDLVFQKNTA